MFALAFSLSSLLALARSARTPRFLLFSLSALSTLDMLFLGLITGELGGVGFRGPRGFLPGLVIELDCLKFTLELLCNPLFSLSLFLNVVDTVVRNLGCDGASFVGESAPRPKSEEGWIALAAGFFC